MNIFEELTESYTYNGTISMKAIEDDIVTLENHIDSLNSTLREINARGKNPGPIREKIRDEKIRLSLLKSFLKKVKEENNASEDDVILGVLGVSGSGAKETEKPSTAANGKQPKQQNFESMEIEEAANETDMETLEPEISDNQNQTESSPELETVEENVESVDNEEVNEAEVESEVEIGQFDDEPETETVTEQENMMDNDIKVEKYMVEKDVYDMRGASEEDLQDLYNSLTSDDKVAIKGSTEKGVVEAYATEINSKIKVADGEIQIVENEDEPKISLSDGILHSVKHINEPPEYCNLVYIDGSKESELPECPPPTLDDYMEPDGDVVADEFDDTVSDVLDFNTVYHAFPDDVPTIGASLDLSRYTNMVNTCNIYVTVNHEDSELYVRFDDIRDYEIFVSLAKEYEDMRRNPLKRLFKKGKSIFMSVTAKHDEETGMNYEYVFSGCKLKGVNSSGYPAVKCGYCDVPDAVNDFISCYVTFKYKKMKVVKIKWYSLSPEKKRVEQR